MRATAAWSCGWWTGIRGWSPSAGSLPLFVGAAGLVVVLGLVDSAPWRFERSLVLAGDWWRPLTAQWFHTSPVHALWNALGLLLVGWLLGPVWRMAIWLVIGLVAGLVVAGGLLMHADIHGYLGLSGLLHGLLVAGAIGLLLGPASAGGGGRRREGGVLLGLLAGKLLWEQIAGPLPGSEAATEGAVIVEAHLYGALGGAVAAVLLSVLVAPDVAEMEG